MSTRDVAVAALVDLDAVSPIVRGHRESVHVMLRSPRPPSFTRRPSRSVTLKPLPANGSTDRHVDRRIRASYKRIERQGVELIVDQNAVAGVVEDGDAEKRNPRDRAGGCTGYFDREAFSRRATHGEQIHRGDRRRR